MLMQHGRSNEIVCDLIIDYSKDFMEESLLALDDIQWDRPGQCRTCTSYLLITSHLN